MTCYCYIVECSDGTYYTGWTTDPERRIKQHNKGVGAKYTSTRRPVKLVYLETQSVSYTHLTLPTSGLV